MFNGNSYTLLFLLLMVFCPIDLGKGTPYHLYLSGAACAIHAAIIGAVAYRVHNDRINFWTGLAKISTSFMSGCGNITLIYIFPVLLYYYVHALAFTVIGIFKGKEYTEDSWVRLVLKRLNHAQENSGW